MVAITIVLPSAVAKLGALDQFDVANLERRFKYLFDKAGLAWVVGCLDYSVNFHKDGNYEPHWSVHLHGFTVTDDLRALRTSLIKVIEKTDAVPRPVMILPWDGSKKATRYVVKTSFYRRQGIDNAQRFNPDTQKTRKSRATNRQRLLSSERLELALHLHAIGWQGRLFMRHAQLRRSQIGPTIALINNHA